MISIWQNRFVLLIASLCAAFLLAFVALPNFASQNWSGSSGENYNWAPKGFGEPKVAQSAGATSSNYMFPELTGRVVDNANLIDAGDEAKLIDKLKAFEALSSDQLVVTTIDSLHGANIEEYSNLLFRKWGLGQAEENNGVLLLISKGDRKIRIEVGYGLEGLLTDAMSKVIIDRVIVPQFKIGDFSTGIVEGAERIIGVLSGDKFELKSRAKRNFQQHSDDVDWFEVIFLIIWGSLFFGPLSFSILAPIFGEKLGPRHYKWLGIEHKPRRGGSGSSGGSGGFGGGYSGGGGGSSGGGGASGGW